MISGTTPTSYTNLQLNAGVFLKDFTYSTYTDKAALLTAVEAAITAGTSLLGATSGGGTFAVTPTYRNIELDGARNDFVGSKVLDKLEVKLTTTLKEITPSNFVMALGVGESTTSGQKTTVKLHNTVATTDYISKLCWVGDLSDTDKLVLISLDNALNTAGATFTFTDKGEGSIPVEFTAHLGALSPTTYAPCEIVFFGTAATP